MHKESGIKEKFAQHEPEYVKVTDSKMAPAFQHGDTILVDHSQPCKNKDYILFDGVLGRLHETNSGSRYLGFLDVNIPYKELPSDAVICKVVQSFRDY